MEMSIYRGPSNLNIGGSTQVYGVFKNQKQVWPPLTEINLGQFSSYKQVNTTLPNVYPIFYGDGTSYNDGSGYIQGAIPNTNVTLTTITVGNMIYEIWPVTIGLLISTIFYDGSTYTSSPSTQFYNYCSSNNIYFTRFKYSIYDSFEMTIEKSSDGYTWSQHNLTFIIYLGGSYNKPLIAATNGTYNNLKGYMIRFSNSTLQGQLNPFYSAPIVYHNHNSNTNFKYFYTDDYVYYIKDQSTPPAVAKNFSIIYTADVINEDFYKPPYVGNTLYCQNNIFSITYATHASVSGSSMTLSGWNTVTFPSGGSGSFGYITSNKLYVCDGKKLPDIPSESTSYVLNTSETSFTIDYINNRIEAVPYALEAYFNEITNNNTNYSDSFVKTNLFNPGYYKSGLTNPILVTHKYDLSNTETHTSSVNTNAYKWVLSSNTITVNWNNYSHIQGKSNVKLWYVWYSKYSPTGGSVYMDITETDSGINLTDSEGTVRWDRYTNCVAQGTTSSPSWTLYSDDYNFNTSNHQCAPNSTSPILPSPATFFTSVYDLSTSHTISLIPIGPDTKLLPFYFGLEIYTWGDIVSRGSRITIKNMYTPEKLSTAFGAPTGTTDTRTLYVYAIFLSGYGERHVTMGFIYLGSVQIQGAVASKTLDYAV